ncbi:STM4014 family protein [Pseudomonas sp. CGJS7]|uniref:STM4014 family protein n=1 Tax=Pseudomonas sp. CGJS7 TaxID=3109348 RepID=UPI00300998D6
MADPGWLLIGPRGSRRILGLQQALHERGLPAAEELHYERLLEAPELAADAIARRPRALVKIESTGEAPQLHTALIERGWRALGQPGPRPRALGHGELAYQHYWYAGFRALLQALPREANYLNPPDDILRMSDKHDCQQWLQAQGVAIPPLLGDVDGYAQLRELGSGQVFIKARYGSSGAGVLAYRRDRRGREVLYGSAELADHERDDRDQPRIYNSLRPRRYTDPRQIAQAVDAVAAQGAYAERWIAKPRAPDGAGHYDIRAIALDGRARHRLARISRTPLTNLHLGNRRGALADWLDTQTAGLLEDATERAAAAFPRSRMIGFDLILRDGRSWILEANAFGDLLLSLPWQGHSTYQDQAALSARALAEPAHA